MCKHLFYDNACMVCGTHFSPSRIEKLIESDNEESEDFMEDDYIEDDDD